jgi:hypothetical protein
MQDIDNKTIFKTMMGCNMVSMNLVELTFMYFKYCMSGCSRKVADAFDTKAKVTLKLIKDIRTIISNIHNSFDTELIDSWLASLDYYEAELKDMHNELTHKWRFNYVQIHN